MNGLMIGISAVSTIFSWLPAKSAVVKKDILLLFK